MVGIDMYKKLITTIFILFISVIANAEEKVVEGVGEALILNNDIGAAKNQAIVRAKWDALEKATSVQVKVETIVQNAMLVDEAIKSEVSGTITDYSIVDEGKDGDTYWVKIRAKVKPDGAIKAVSQFAKNTSIAVLLPVVFPDGKVLESSPLSEKLTSELLAQNYEVVDIAAHGSPYNINELNDAMKSDNYLLLRNVAYRFLSGVVLVGKVETIASAKEGKNIGYGINIPFNIVNGKLTYKLIGDKDGNKILLDSGYVSARGQGATVEDATYNMLENLANEVSTNIVSKVSEKIRGNYSKKIEVVLAGNSNVDRLMQLKNDIQYIAWVLNVEEKGVDKLVVDYPEKPIYLANALEQKRIYFVKKIEGQKIILESSR
jgi:hypothetical protein